MAAQMAPHWAAYLAKMTGIRAAARKAALRAVRWEFHWAGPLAAESADWKEPLRAGRLAALLA
jgi:hypothetical protein